LKAKYLLAENTVRLNLDENMMFAEDLSISAV
jgi:hypothetical protein